MIQGNNYKITVSLACYGRPLETRRAIESVTSQDMDGWELLAVGDNCPDFENLIHSDWMREQTTKAEANGNRIHCYNRAVRGGAWGTQIINENIHNANGEYFVFFANDDWLHPSHLRNYYNAIKTPMGFKYQSLVDVAGGLDFVYFNGMLPTGGIRKTKLELSRVGHSELVIKTSFLKQMPPHKPLYGHDWELIRNMMHAGAKYCKSANEPTYYVGHLPTAEEIQHYRQAGISIEGWPVWKQITRTLRKFAISFYVTKPA